jgi:membrane protein YqaA with SNARE-associated domain
MANSDNSEIITPDAPPEAPLDTPRSTPGPVATRNPLKRLYYWCIKWAETKYAVPALGGMSFAESSFFPIPPDVLLIALTFSAPRKWLKFAGWCTLASVLGGIFGYYIGWGLWETVGEPIVKFYHGEAVMAKISGWYTEHGFFGIVLAAITPIPYKVFTIASGMFGFPLAPFILASIVGRGIRFFLVAGLIRYFGEKVRPFIEERLELMMLLFGVLLVLGFVALKFLR